MDDLKEILAAAAPGPWAYRPTEHDDWGTVRSGKWFICQAKDPRFFDDDFLNDCRARRIDPWEANARLIAMAPDLAAEVLRLRAEVERLTKALTEIADMDWHEVEPAHGWVPEGAEGYVGEIEAFCNWALDVSRAALKGTTQ